MDVTVAGSCLEERSDRGQSHAGTLQPAIDEITPLFGNGIVLEVHGPAFGGLENGVSSAKAERGWKVRARFSRVQRKHVARFGAKCCMASPLNKSKTSGPAIDTAPPRRHAAIECGPSHRDRRS